MTLHRSTNAVFRSQDVPWLQWAFGVSSYVSLLPGFLIFHLTGSNCSSLHESRQDSENPHMPPPPKIQQHQLGCLQTQRPHTGRQGTCANLRLPEESHGQKRPPEIELLRSGYDLGNLFPGKKSDWTDTAQKWMGCSQPGSFISSYAGEPISESPRGGNQTQMMESASLKSTS